MMIVDLARGMTSVARRRPLTVGPMAMLVGWISFDMSHEGVSLNHISEHPEVLLVLTTITLAGMLKDTIDKTVRAWAVSRLSGDVDDLLDPAEADEFGGER